MGDMGRLGKASEECPAFKDGACPVKNPADMSKIKDCPAFEDSCPYDTKDSAMVDKAKTCPAFKESEKGCPFADTSAIGECPEFKKQGTCPMAKPAVTTAAMSAAERCPVLQENKATLGGCPMGDMGRLGKASEKCPAFKDGACPVKTPADMSKIKDCPAFEDSCPYDTKDAAVMDKAKTCPAFKESEKGCPFAEAQNVSNCPEFKKQGTCPMSKL
jgi:hypothetical protein